MNPESLLKAAKNKAKEWLKKKKLAKELHLRKNDDLKILELLMSNTGKDDAMANKIIHELIGAMLLHACVYGNKKIVDELAFDRRTTNRDYKYKDGMTPLMHACVNGHTDIVKLLIHDYHQTVNLNDTDNFGMTPLMFACAYGHKDIVKSLIHKLHSGDAVAININKANTDGVTPLMFACANGYKEIVELLLNYAPMVDLKDNNGNTALMHANTNHHTQIAELFESKKPRFTS